mmetsp:Transcript_29696/g.44814  ORF Transcript_29696/g.44814 Transcript_29696/m.44814 type:complete len:96 (+) Transcript_29696:46-333(+)
MKRQHSYSPLKTFASADDMFHALGRTAAAEHLLLLRQLRRCILAAAAAAALDGCWTPILILGREWRSESRWGMLTIVHDEATALLLWRGSPSSLI